MEKAEALKSVLLDTGVLYALADRKDAWHRRCAAFVEAFEGRFVVPSPVIPEACYLMNTHLGPRAELIFVRALAAGELTIAHFTADDLSRCAALLKAYADAGIAFVDASVAAMAERLRIDAIATTDRRHFSLLKDAAGNPFRLLP